MRGRSTALPGQSFAIEMDEHGQRAVLPLKNDWRRALVWLALGLAIASTHSLEFFREGEISPAIAGAIVSLVMATVFFFAELTFTFFGKETLAVKDGKLVHRWSALGLRRSREYPVAAIEAVTVGWTITGVRRREVKPHEPVSPFRDFGRRGRIKLDCNGSYAHLGAAIEENAARQVVAWLRPQLPRGVVYLEEAPKRFSELR